MITYPVLAGNTLTRVYEAGHTNNPTIVLVHGLSSRADRWIRNIDALASAGYHVIAPDLPGHGFASKNPEFDHSIGGYADFLLALLTSLQLKKVILVGTSFGGQVVATAALRDPERIEKMVMIGSTGFSPSTPERVEGLRNWLFHLTPTSHRPYLERVFSDKALISDDMVAEDVMINTSPGARQCFERLLNYMASSKFNDDLVLDKLPAIEQSIPLLLFWGTEDTSVSVELGRKARQQLSFSRLITVTGLNHTPYYEAPELFNTILLSFIENKLESVKDTDVTLE